MSLEILLFVLLGLAFGSFGNVLLVRLKKGQSIGGRSHCMKCRRELGAVDLVPVISYVLLGGRCRYCGKTISLLYPIVEILSAAVFALSAVLYPGSLPLAILTGFLLYTLLLSSVFDILYQELPDIFTAIIAGINLVITLLSGSPSSSLFGLGLVLIWFGGQWVLSRGRAVGTGDIFLASALAIWLGLSGTVLMLLLSYIVGALTVLLLLGLRMITWKHQHIAFGPFLAIGALLTLLGVGQEYLSIFF